MATTVEARGQESATLNDPRTVAASIRVVIHKAEPGGYWAEFPAFPWVYAEGDTIDDARRDTEATLARNFEMRENRRADEAGARACPDEAGPIPSISDRVDGLGTRMPLPGRVKATRALAAERRRKDLDALPDDPPGTDEALLEALGVDVPDRT